MCGGANKDSDYYLVGMIFRARITLPPRIRSDNEMKTETINNKVVRIILKGRKRRSMEETIRAINRFKNQKWPRANGTG